MGHTLYVTFTDGNEQKFRGNWLDMMILANTLEKSPDTVFALTLVEEEWGEKVYLWPKEKISAGG